MARVEPIRIRALDSDADARLRLGLDELRQALPSVDRLAETERALARSLAAEPGAPADVETEENSGIRRLRPVRPRRRSVAPAMGVMIAVAAVLALWFSTHPAARPLGSEAVLAPRDGERRAPALHESETDVPPVTEPDQVSERLSTRTAPHRPRARVVHAVHVDPAPRPAFESVSEASFEPIEDGRVNINSIPITAVVLDGRPLGGTPRVGVMVSPGEHTVLFVHPKRGRKSVRVNVDPGGTVLAAVRF